MWKDFFTLAARSLRKRKLRSWLTMIGIFIGIAAVVSLVSLGQGLQDAVQAQFSEVGADRITVQPAGGGFGPPGEGAAAELTTKDLDVLQKVSGVDVATGRMLEPSTLRFNDEDFITYTASMPDEKDERELIIDFQNPTMESGRLITEDDKFDVTIGSAVAREENYGQAIRVGDRITIQGSEFDVVGIMEKSGSPATDQAILMNEEIVRDLFDEPEIYNVLVARTGDDIDRVSENIEKDLRQHREVEEGKEDFVVQTAQDLIQSFTSILNVVSGVLIGIALISLLVGGIGIMNTMYTSVLERTREIGVMKAVGARNEDILSLFLIESGMLGMLGGAIGVTLGIGLSKTVEYIAVQQFGPNILQASVSPYLIIGSLLFAFLVGALSGALPARQASKLQPVEALQHD